MSRSYQIGGAAPGELIAKREAVEEEAGRGLRLGYVQRTCEVCGKEWIGPDVCHQGRCTSVMFTEQPVKAAASMIAGLGVTELEAPPKPRIEVTAQEIGKLRRLRAALVDLDARLKEADEAARVLVNRNVTNLNVFGRLQQVLTHMTAPGDYEIRVFDPIKSISLVGPVRGLIAEIDTTIRHYEEELSQ
jgi:hypothetical protein